MRFDWNFRLYEKGSTIKEDMADLIESLYHTGLPVLCMAAAIAVSPWFLIGILPPLVFRLDVFVEK